MSSAIQNILIILGLLVVALLGGYLYLDQTNQSLSLSAFRSEPTIVDVQSQEFLARLDQLQAINLNTDAVFGNQQFQSLVDYTLPVTPQPTGRDNPFEPASAAAVITSPTN